MAAKDKSSGSPGADHRGHSMATLHWIQLLISEPSWREDHLLRLVKERLHRAELTVPVIAVRLDATKVESATPASDTLFPEPGGSPEDHARLIELLVARLGEASRRKA